ncbi:hypothetical protein ACLOJK_019287 [Asimina triloba]
MKSLIDGRERNPENAFKVGEYLLEELVNCWMVKRSPEGALNSLFCSSMINPQLTEIFERFPRLKVLDLSCTGIHHCHPPCQPESGKTTDPIDAGSSFGFAGDTLVTDGTGEGRRLTRITVCSNSSSVERVDRREKLVLAALVNDGVGEDRSLAPIGAGRSSLESED